MGRFGQAEAGDCAPKTDPSRRVLVVDDSAMQRKILSASLTRAGYRVTEAESGERALELCAVDPPDFVLSDWMMKGMTGLDFCRAFRAMPRESYGYFILLTSKNEVSEIALGLEAGADDFLTKPVTALEIRARLAAGERILGMEAELKRKNRLVSSTLSELQGLYDSINRDLMEAKKLQQSLVKERHRSFGNAEVSLFLHPSGHVGGDLVGFFPINARRVGLYAIDVSGHGITSALMTARLAGFLSGTSPEQNLALILSDLGIYDARPPDELAAYLNDLVLEELQTENYFTLAYADVDLISGQVEMVQAGHPHPIVQRADGRVESFGSGGLPIGLIEGARHTPFEARLSPGDRLFLMSDGITEAEDPSGRQLGDEGLARLMAKSRGLGGPAFLEALVRDIAAFTGGDFGDDLSGVLFEFHGAKKNAD
ncbi:PP2C family protein-serine/threonine phosphatase [Ostreiculturibacter nitratireducens]|uniref:PP2C family protein-serine/threonine phosphatase n=1 Tax=Ostreiculturibacter nitratireducens TaxID=3075226 RepID=UPI0031B5D9B3